MTIEDMIWRHKNGKYGADGYPFFIEALIADRSRLMAQLEKQVRILDAVRKWVDIVADKSGVP